MYQQSLTTVSHFGLALQVWSGGRDRMIVAYDAATGASLFNLGDQVRLCDSRCDVRQAGR